MGEAVVEAIAGWGVYRNLFRIISEFWKFCLLFSCIRTLWCRIFAFECNSVCTEMLGNIAEKQLFTYVYVMYMWYVGDMWSICGRYVVDMWSKWGRNEVETGRHMPNNLETNTLHTIFTQKNGTKLAWKVSMTLMFFIQKKLSLSDCFFYLPNLVGIGDGTGA